MGNLRGVAAGKLASAMDALINLPAARLSVSFVHDAAVLSTGGRLLLLVSMIPRLLWFAFLLGFLLFFQAFAQGTFATVQNAPSRDDGIALAKESGTAIPGAFIEAAHLDMTGKLTGFLIDLAFRHPWIVTLLGLIGFLRVILKPAMALLHGYVATTQDKGDDELLEKVERSWIFAAFSWLLDFLGSVKLDTLKAARSKTGPTNGTAAALALALPVGALAGCKGPKAAAFRTIASVQAVAQKTLVAWADHVVERRAQIAKLPAAAWRPFSRLPDRLTP